nr:glutamyl-tRNA reductase [Actinomycetota bacterium]
ALDRDGVAKLIREVSDGDYVAEATVLSTCNRTEVYADVDRFHDSVEAITRLMCEQTGDLPEELLPHLYVHYEDGAVSHLFHVVAGLDSMVVGESQILGQAREALRAGQEAGTVGPALNSLFQQALRVGKRSHAETGIDRAGASLVATALDRAAAHLGSLADRRALVVGAGAMARLTVSTLVATGACDVVVANRTLAHADRLASAYAGTAVALAEAPDWIGRVDLLVSCTGSSGVLLEADAVSTARAGRTDPFAILDLALPHDVDPSVGRLPGVLLVDLAALAGLQHGEVRDDVEAVRAIVAQELAAYLAARRSASVTPTVVALRTMATGVVDAELRRLATRLPDLDEPTREEIDRAVRRVADKLLHQPTVRVRELANETGVASYAAALTELFALDPEAVEAVTRPEGLR